MVPSCYVYGIRYSSSHCLLSLFCFFYAEVLLLWVGGREETNCILPLGQAIMQSAATHLRGAAGCPLLAGAGAHRCAGQPVLLLPPPPAMARPVRHSSSSSSRNRVSAEEEEVARTHATHARSTHEGTNPSHAPAFLPLLCAGQAGHPGSHV